MDTLSPKQRLHLALQRKKTDRPPCICPGGMMNMITEEIMDKAGTGWPEAHSDPRAMADLAAAVWKNGGFENIGVPFCMTVEAEALGAVVSMGSRVHEPHVTGYAIGSVTEWRELRPLDVSAGRAGVVVEAIRLLKKDNADVPIIANLCGPVSLATSLVDPMVLYRELYKKKEQAHEMLGFIADNLIAFGKAQIRAGADVLTISEPSGTGEILGMRGFTAYTLPYLNKILAALQSEADVRTIVHICGKLRKIYPAISDINSQAISFDSITSARQMADNVGNKAIMGNISTYVLEHGSPDKLGQIAARCVAQGVDIIAPACGIGARTPLENIRSVVAAAKNMAGNDSDNKNNDTPDNAS